MTQLTSHLSQISPVLLSGIADVACKGLGIMLLTGTAILFMRRASAAARHLVWFLGLLGVLILPLLSASLPGWHVLPQWTKNVIPAAPAPIVAPPPVAPPVQKPTPQIPAVPRIIPHQESPPVFIPASPHIPAPITPAKIALPPAPPPAIAPPSPAFHITWQTWLLLAWLTGAILLIAYIALGSLSLFLLRKKSEQITQGDWLALLTQTCTRLNFTAKVELLTSPRRSMPMTWGIFRTRVLLPAESQNWSADQRSAVLLHELAHAKRGDCLSQLAARFACALHWFNPLVWLAWHRMQAEREQACDDLVLSTGAKASAYAEQLLHIAREMPAVRFSAAAIAMARPSRLEGRLRAILDTKRNRRRMTGMGITLAILAALALIVPMACMNVAPIKRHFIAATIHVAPDIQLESSKKLIQLSQQYGQIVVLQDEHKRLEAELSHRPDLKNVLESIKTHGADPMAVAGGDFENQIDLKTLEAKIAEAKAKSLDATTAELILAAVKNAEQQKSLATEIQTQRQDDLLKALASSGGHDYQINDSAEIDKLMAFFPQLGEKSNHAGGWTAGAQIKFTSEDGHITKIDVSQNDDFKTWSEGFNGDWPVVGDFNAFLTALRHEQATAKPAKGFGRIADVDNMLLIGRAVDVTDKLKLDAWLEGAEVVEAGFAGRADSQQLIDSLKVKESRDDQFIYTSRETNGNSSVDVRMNVTPDNYRRLVQMSDDLRAIGVRLDPKLPRIWSYTADPIQRKIARKMIPGVLVSARKAIEKISPRAAWTFTNGGPDTKWFQKPDPLALVGAQSDKFSANLLITDITVDKLWELSQHKGWSNDYIHLPHLGMMARIAYAMQGPDDARTATPETEAARQAFHQALDPLIALEAQLAAAPATTPSAPANEYLEKVKPLLPKGWSVRADGDDLVIKRDQAIAGEDGIKPYPLEITLRIVPLISPDQRERWAIENEAATKKWLAEGQTPSIPGLRALPTNFDQRHSVIISCWQLEYFQSASDAEQAECKKVFDTVAGLFNAYATAPATQPAIDDLPEGDASVQLFDDDKTPAGIYAVVGPTKQSYNAQKRYKMAAAGEEPGHYELVGRMEGVYHEGDEFIVASFIRAGNKIVADIHYVPAPDKPRADPPKRAYIRAQIPKDLPAGRYEVLVQLSEYQREGGKLVVAPKTEIRASENLTCSFEVPQADGQNAPPATQPARAKAQLKSPEVWALEDEQMNQLLTRKREFVLELQKLIADGLMPNSPQIVSIRARIDGIDELIVQRKQFDEEHLAPATQPERAKVQSKSPEVWALEDEQMNQLLMRKRDLVLELQEMATAGLLPNHPRVISIRSQIDAADVLIVQRKQFDDERAAPTTQP